MGQQKRCVGTPRSDLALLERINGTLKVCLYAALPLLVIGPLATSGVAQDYATDIHFDANAAVPSDRTCPWRLWEATPTQSMPACSTEASSAVGLPIAQPVFWSVTSAEGEICAAYFQSAPLRNVHPHDPQGLSIESQRAKLRVAPSTRIAVLSFPVVEDPSAAPTWLADGNGVSALWFDSGSTRPPTRRLAVLARAMAGENLAALQQTLASHEFPAAADGGAGTSVDAAVAFLLKGIPTSASRSPTGPTPAREVWTAKVRGSLAGHLVLFDPPRGTRCSKTGPAPFTQEAVSYYWRAQQIDLLPDLSRVDVYPDTGAPQNALEALAAEATVRIESEIAHDIEGCTGTLLAPTLAITARHCICSAAATPNSATCASTQEFQHSPSLSVDIYYQATARHRLVSVPARAFYVPPEIPGTPIAKSEDYAMVVLEPHPLLAKKGPDLCSVLYKAYGAESPLRAEGAIYSHPLGLPTHTARSCWSVDKARSADLLFHACPTFGVSSGSMVYMASSLVPWGIHTTSIRDCLAGSQWANALKGYMDKDAQDLIDFFERKWTNARCIGAGVRLDKIKQGFCQQSKPNQDLGVATLQKGQFCDLLTAISKGDACNLEP